MRRTCALALLTTSALLATASPGTAGSTSSRTYAATWSSAGGSLVAELGAASSTRLVDQDSYDDKVNAVPGGDQRVAVGGVQCAQGSAYASGVNVWGAGHQWAAMAVGGPAVGVRVQVSCVHPGGALHRYNWGAERLSNGSWSSASTNCVKLTRTSTHTFALSADGSCPVQDEVLDPKPSKQLSARNGLSKPFTATVQLTASAPAAVSS